MALTAIILGATGLVGNELLQLLLTSSHFTKVKIFARKRLDITHEKLEQHVISFDSIAGYSEEIKGDVFFCCIGTTIKVAGSKEAFIKVDYTYPFEFAQIAKANGTNHFIVISSIGANPNSSNFYLKVKGDTELALRQLNFKSLDIVRPSLLLGKRSEKRFGESISKVLLNALAFLFVGKLRKYKPIEARTVARAMLELSTNSTQKTPPLENVRIISSDKLQELGTL